MFKFRSWGGVVGFAVDASPKAPTVGKYVHVALILGVLPRNTTAKPTTPPHLLTCITFLSLGGREKSKEKSIRTRALVLFLSFDVALALALPHQ